MHTENEKGIKACHYKKINERQRKSSREEKKDKITIKQTENNEQNVNSESFSLSNYSQFLYGLNSLN